MKRILSLILIVVLLMASVPAVSAQAMDTAEWIVKFQEIQTAVEACIADLTAPAESYETYAAEFSQNHKALIESANSYGGVQKYIVTDYEAADLLTQAEIDSLIAQNQTRETVTYDEAVEDMDLFFRALKSAYGGYYYFGDAAFDRAKNEMMTWLNGKSTVNRVDMETKLAESMDFLQDAHFAIGDVDRGQDLEYEYYYTQGQYYDFDGAHYTKTVNGEKWTFVSFTDSRVRMEKTLTEEGKVAYSPILFCPEPDMKNSSVRLKNTAGKVKTESLTFVRNESYWDGYRGEVDYNFVKEDGVAYISLRSCDNYFSDTLFEYAQSGSDVQDAGLIIFDIRGNGGGSEVYSMEWIMNFVGYSPSLPIVGGTRYSALRTAMGFDDGSVRPGTFESYQVDGRWIENDIPIIVLVDEYVASAGESTLNYLRALDNVTVVGSNSAGLQLCGNNMGFTLPNSGMFFYFGTGLNFPFDTQNRDFKGYEPDIWVNPKDSLDLVMKMVERYQIADTTAGELDESLKNVVTEKSSIRLNLVMDLNTGALAPDPELKPGERCGMPTIDASQCWMVYKDGVPRSDYTVWSANPEICKITRIDGWCNDTVFETRVVSLGTVKFYVTVDDETAEFIFFAG